MKRIFSIFFLLSVLSLGAIAQKPIPSGPTLPPTCKVNDLFIKTSVGIYLCTATNTWTLQGGGTPGTTTGTVQAYNVVTDGLCVNTGLANMTTCLNSAFIAANTANKQAFLPGGNYLGNPSLNGLNSLRIFGEGPGRTIIQSATGSLPVFFANNAGGLTHSLTIEEMSFRGIGSGGSDHGFRMSPDQPFDLTMRNVRVTNTNGHGIYIPTNAFTLLLEGVDVSSIGGNGFDIGGDNTVKLTRTYCHRVGNGKSCYRLHSGRFILDIANGMDGLETDGSWGLFGDKTSEDGVDAYAFVKLIGSNVEAWTSTSYGIRVKTGSKLSLDNTNFITLPSVTTSAILFDDADPNLDGNYVGRMDGLSAFTLGAGASWTNGSPVRSKGIPFLQDGNRAIDYYDTTLAHTVLMPYQSLALNGAAFRGVTKFNRVTFGTGANEGVDGDINMIDDNTRKFGQTASGRAFEINVGTGGIHLGAGAVPINGTNWSLTGGTSPLLQFNDGTVNGVFQGLTTTGIRAGTVSAHPFQILTNNTATWEFTAAGDLRVLTGSHDFGQVAGNRAENVRAGTALAAGIPGGSTKGSLVFGNINNTNTQTFESADTPAASNRYKWPAASPTVGQILSASAPSSGVVTETWVDQNFSAPTVFASLGTPSNGKIQYCSDCTVTSGADNTCAGSGSGALAIRLNGIWRCFNAQN